jgi:hypothetical protein
MRFFTTETEAINVENIAAVDIDDDPGSLSPCCVVLDCGKTWYLTREDGLRLLDYLRVA